LGLTSDAAHQLEIGFVKEINTSIEPSDGIIDGKSDISAELGDILITIENKWVGLGSQIRYIYMFIFARC
jgi:hypothetical protein